MGEIGQNTENPECQLYSSWQEIFEVIRKEYNFSDEERADIVCSVITAITEQPGTTVQDALDILKDAKKILLQYQLIC